LVSYPLQITQIAQIIIRIIFHFYYRPGKKYLSRLKPNYCHSSYRIDTDILEHH